MIDYSSKIIEAYRAGQQVKQQREDRERLEKQQELQQKNLEAQVKREEKRHTDLFKIQKRELELNEQRTKSALRLQMLSNIGAGNYIPPGAFIAPDIEDTSPRSPFDSNEPRFITGTNKPGFTDELTGIKYAPGSYNLPQEIIRQKQAEMEQLGTTANNIAADRATKVEGAKLPFEVAREKRKLQYDFALLPVEQQAAYNELAYKHNLNKSMETLRQSNRIALQQLKLNGQKELKTLNDSGVDDIIIAQRASELSVGAGRPVNYKDPIDRAATILLNTRNQAIIPDPAVARKDREALAQMKQVLQQKKLLLSPDYASNYFDETGIFSKLGGKFKKLYPSDFKALLDKQKTALGGMVKAAGESASAQFSNKDAERWEAAFIDPEKSYKYNKDLYLDAHKAFIEYTDRVMNGLGIKDEGQKRAILETWGIFDEYYNEDSLASTKASSNPFKPGELYNGSKIISSELEKE